MTHEEIKTAAIAAITELLDPDSNPSLAELIKQDDFEFSKMTTSSIVLVEMCMHMEENLGIEIEIADIFDNQRFSQFIERILEKSANV